MCECANISSWRALSCETNIIFVLVHFLPMNPLSLTLRPLLDQNGLVLLLQLQVLHYITFLLVLVLNLRFFYFFILIGEHGNQVAFNDKRTSDNAFDTSSTAAMALKKRALDLLGMTPYDEKLTDGLQVLRYNLTTAYNSHMDYLDDNGGGHDYDSANQVLRACVDVFFLSLDFL